MTHKLETSNIKEVLPLFWRFWATCQASHPGDLTNGLGIPRESDFEGQRDLITWLLQDWGKENLQAWQAQTKPWTHQDSEERSSDLPGDWTKTTCWCWGGLLWKCWSAGAHHGMGALAAAVWEGHSLCKPSSRSPLTRPWSWVTSGQNYQRGSATPPKALLSKTLPTRERPSFSHYQPLPSEGLHKPLNLLH